jgi:hypothetical protein
MRIPPVWKFILPLLATIIILALIVALSSCMGPDQRGAGEYEVARLFCVVGDEVLYDGTVLALFSANYEYDEETGRVGGRVYTSGQASCVTVLQYTVWLPDSPQNLSLQED